MHHFRYKDQELSCEGVRLSELANKYETPLFVYSESTIVENYQALERSLGDLDHEIAYAVKANSNISIISLLKELGSSFDIVSGGELERVIKAGGAPNKCTFAGVGKTKKEIQFALKSGIYCFNVESEAELNAINLIASDMNKIAPIAIRVNPNVDAKTHKYISTGKSKNKFGIDFESVEAVYERASQLKSIELKGIQMHIGSQLTSVTPFQEAVEKVTPLAIRLKETYGIEFFSIGGGIGIVYEDALASGDQKWWDSQSDTDRPLTPELYAAKIKPSLKASGLKIQLEPGRYLVGNAGVLLTECLYEKKGSEKTFKIVDAAMNDLIRPALYEGHHEIVPLHQKYDQTAVIDIVGPVCESGDFFCQNRTLPDFQPGDLMALMSAGAYAAAMASNYNTRPYPAEILVAKGEYNLIRTRQTFHQQIHNEALCFDKIQ